MAQCRLFESVEAASSGPAMPRGFAGHKDPPPNGEGWRGSAGEGAVGGNKFQNNRISIQILRLWIETH